MENINFVAVAVAALTTFCLGGLWYSPVLFLNPWFAADDRPKMKDQKRHGPKVFILAYLASFVAALVFAVIIGGKLPVGDSLGWGLKVGIGFVSTSFAINYMFAARSFKLLLIDGGYHIVQFLFFGLILSLWP